MSAAPPTQPDLKSTLEEMRASMAAGGAPKGFAARAGLTGAIQKAILSLLGVLLAMLEDFRAGRLAPSAAIAEPGAGAAAADHTPRRFPRGLRGATVAVHAEYAAIREVLAEEDEALAQALGGCAQFGREAGRLAHAAADGDASMPTRDAAAATRPDPRLAPRQAARAASPRAPRFEMTSHARDRAGSRDASGIRQAFQPCAAKAGAVAGHFFKNAVRRGRIGAPSLFQHDNDSAAFRVISIFS